MEFDTFKAKGRQRKSLAELTAAYAETDSRDKRVIHEVLAPIDAGILLFRTSKQGCLTHITRYVSHCIASYREGLSVTAYSECGIMGYGGDRYKPEYRVMLVRDPADETFGCRTCIERAERYGATTYGLIPDTGCSATGGARYRPRLRLRPFGHGPDDDFDDLFLPPPVYGDAVVTADSIGDYLAALDAIDRYVKTLDKPQSV